MNIYLKRRMAALAVVVAAVAPAVAVASSASPRARVSSYVDRSGTVHVSGYDGGAPLQP